MSAAADRVAEAAETVLGQPLEDWQRRILDAAFPDPPEAEPPPVVTTPATELLTAHERGSLPMANLVALAHSRAEKLEGAEGDGTTAREVRP